MAKMDIVKSIEKAKTTKSEAMQGQGDRVVFLISSGLQNVKELAEIYDTINKTGERRKAADTDNIVKLSITEIDSQKESNRHDEAMAKIEQEYKKISDAAAVKDRRLSFIQEYTNMLQAEYKKYIELDTDKFLSDPVTSRLENLRNVILELTKELKV